jgi:hypothetical protein
MSNKPIGIKELIDRAKAELLEQHDASNPIFAIKQVELTINFTVERSGEGGIDFQVVKVGAGKTSSEAQTIHVVLESLVTPDDVRAKLSETQRKNATNSVTRSFRTD